MLGKFKGTHSDCDHSIYKIKNEYLVETEICWSLVETFFLFFFGKDLEIIYTLSTLLNAAYLNYVAIMSKQRLYKNVS